MHRNAGDRQADRKTAEYINVQRHLQCSAVLPPVWIELSLIDRTELSLMATSIRALVILAALAVLGAVAAAAAALDTSPVAFDAGFAPLFGGDNLVRSPDGRSVQLKLDRYTGA